MKKVLKVCDKVFTRKGEPYEEFKTDGFGRIFIDEDTKVYNHQLTKDDVPLTEEKRVGDIIIYALDLPDDKMTTKERRARFTLTAQIQSALNSDSDFLMEREDEKRIEEAVDLIKNSSFFVNCILTALEEAEKEEKAEKKATANRAEAHN